MSLNPRGIAKLLRRQQDPEPPPKKPITAFVVDDEQIIASTVATILTVYGFNASAFVSAEDALEAAAEHGSPDILISDVAMPGMSGIDLAMRFEKLYANCKLLLFSGQAATSEALALARSQGHDFVCLAKPVHPKVLLEAIQNISESA